jgi:hypothetical protein
LQFVLWDNAGGGTQIGTTQTSSNVSVSGGIFSVLLDFGAATFPGGPRFLEISARLVGSGGFVLLTPREQIMSTPYAVRSSNATLADTATIATTATTATNATQLGGGAAGQYVLTSDSRLTLGRRPKFAEYFADRQQVVGGATLDAAKTAFAGAFVLRDEFKARYQSALAAESFVDALLSSALAIRASELQINSLIPY